PIVFLRSLLPPRHLRSFPTRRSSDLSAVEELLRYESPSQHTIRTAPEDSELGGRVIGAGHSVIAVLGAANRDPEQFPDPDRLDLDRKSTRLNSSHLVISYAVFCLKKK